MRFRMTDLALFVGVLATVASLARFGLTMHPRGFHADEIITLVGIAAALYIVVSWAAVALLRRWKKATTKSAHK